MHTGATEKLELGLERLAKAGSDADMLGLALQSIHGALEDHFRVVLSTDAHMPESQRLAVLDPKQVQWKDLLDAMVLYRDLSADDREEIWRINGIRAKVAHGGRYSGSRADLEAYARLVQRLGDYTPSKPAAPAARSSSAVAAAERQAQRAEASRSRVGLPPVPAPASQPQPPPQRVAPRPASPAASRPAPTRPAERDEAPAIPRAVRAARPPAPRSRLGWLLIAGAIALLGLLALTALVRNTTTAAPTSQAQAPAPTSTALPPTSAPAATAGPRGATIVAEGGLNVRADHTLVAEVLFTADNGTRVSIVGGPVVADEHTWWKIEAGGRQGWSAGEFLQLDSSQ